MKFEIYKDKKREFRVRLTAANGNVICATEGYATKKSALKAIEIIISVDASVPVVEVTK